jgi:hypothetical protein
MIANLVENAIHYGATGGSITVAVGMSSPGRICLAVEDDGPGIPHPERRRVFERFYRIPGSPGDGAGLGLSIVREIARGHGGRVQLLDGAGGRGLRVEVLFPETAPSLNFLRSVKTSCARCLADADSRAENVPGGFVQCMKGARQECTRIMSADQLRHCFNLAERINTWNQ